MFRPTSTNCPVLWYTIFSGFATPLNSTYPGPSCLADSFRLHIIWKGTTRFYLSCSTFVIRTFWQSLGHGKSDDHLYLLLLRPSSLLMQRRYPAEHCRFDLLQRFNGFHVFFFFLTFSFLTLFPCFYFGFWCTSTWLRKRGIRSIDALISRPTLFLEESIDSFGLEEVYRSALERRRSAKENNTFSSSSLFSDRFFLFLAVSSRRSASSFSLRGCFLLLEPSSERNLPKN